MFSLLLAVIFGLVFAIFATQNTANVVVKFLPFDFISLPIYAIVILSIIVGLVLGWLFTLTQALSSTFALRGRDRTINSIQRDRSALEQKVRDLEVENAQLKGEQSVEPEPVKTPHHSVFSFR